MAVTTVGQTMPDLKSLNRVKTEIPMIRLGCDYVTKLIVGLKKSSTVLEWSFNKATGRVDQVVNNPYIRDGLLAVDRMLCTSLDLTELNLPVLTKMPQEVYEESVEYVMGIVAPITDWVDMELLPPAEYYVDFYLPELDLDRKTKHMNNEKGSRACGLAVKLTRRVMQHAYAEPKYLGNLLYRGYEETVLLIKILIFDAKLLPKTFRQIWRKLGDGVSPAEAANSLLLIEMGCSRLRNGASWLVQSIEITEEMARCYVEMYVRYINAGKNCVVEHLSRVVNPAIKQQMTEHMTDITVRPETIGPSASVIESSIN